MYQHFIEGLQRLGRALMLPIAILPIAGLLLRLGDTDLLNIAVMHDAGQAIFANLALIFAIGIAEAQPRKQAPAQAKPAAPEKPKMPMATPIRTDLEVFRF